MNLFRKTPPKPTIRKTDWTQRTPQTPEDYLNRGMAFYARKQYAQAEEDLRRAVAERPDFVDAWYSLGLVLKAQGRKDDARTAFEKTLGLLEDTRSKDKVRASMLERLTRAHLESL